MTRLRPRDISLPRRQGKQFNKNYQPGSISTNNNYVLGAPGGLIGQQNYNHGSSAYNYAHGKKKREASFKQNYQLPPSHPIGTVYGVAPIAPGSVLNFDGASITNIERKKRQFNQVLNKENPK